MSYHGKNHYNSIRRDLTNDNTWNQPCRKKEHQDGHEGHDRIWEKANIAGAKILYPDLAKIRMLEGIYHNEQYNAQYTSEDYEEKHPEHQGWMQMYKKAMTAAVRKLRNKNFNILEIGPGMYAHITTMATHQAINMGMNPKPIAIESDMAAEGQAANTAEAILLSLKGHLIHGHSTTPLVVQEAIEKQGTQDHTIAISEMIGEIFSAEGYPYTYSRAMHDNLFNKQTTAIPAEGATLWRPANSNMTTVRRGTKVRMGQKIIYSEPDREEHFTTSTWGVWEYYDLNTSSEKAATQLHQINNSRLEVHNKGHINSIIMAMWAKLGEIPGTYHDPLIDACPEMHANTDRTKRAAIVHSAQGYDGYSSKWQTPRIFLEPGEDTQPQDYIHMRAVSNVGFADTYYDLTVTLERDGLIIRTWSIKLQHMDVCPPYEHEEHEDPMQNIPLCDPTPGMEPEECTITDHEEHPWEYDLNTTLQNEPYNQDMGEKHQDQQSHVTTHDNETLDEEIQGSPQRHDNEIPSPEATPTKQPRTSPKKEKQPKEGNTPKGMKTRKWNDGPKAMQGIIWGSKREKRGYICDPTKGVPDLYLAKSNWLPHMMSDGTQVVRRGLFTSKNIKKGQIITTYAGTGKYVNIKEVGTAEAAYYMGLLRGNTPDSMYVIDGIREIQKGLGYGSFCNDRRGKGINGGNNAEKIVNGAIGTKGQHKHMGIYIRATEAIPAGTEITIPYGKDYFKFGQSEEPDSQEPWMMDQADKNTETISKRKTKPVPTNNPLQHQRGKIPEECTPDLLQRAQKPQKNHTNGMT